MFAATLAVVGMQVESGSDSPEKMKKRFFEPRLTLSVTLNSDVSWKCSWIVFAASSNVSATGCSGPAPPPDLVPLNDTLSSSRAIFSVVSSTAEYAEI